MDSQPDTPEHPVMVGGLLRCCVALATRTAPTPDSKLVCPRCGAHMHFKDGAWRLSAPETWKSMYETMLDCLHAWESNG